MTAKEFLQNKFNCTDDEIHKQLYDLVSDHRNWELVLKLFEDFKNQSEGPTDTEIKDLNSFNAYLIKVAETKVGFRFKVKELKRVINTIINHVEVPEEPIQLDPSHVKSYGNGYR